MQQNVGNAVKGNSFYTILMIDDVLVILVG